MANRLRAMCVCVSHLPSGAVSHTNVGNSSVRDLRVDSFEEHRERVCVCVERRNTGESKSEPWIARTAAVLVAADRETF